MNTEIIQLNLGIVNAYLLKTNNEFILVDTGGFTSWHGVNNRRSLLDKELEKNGCNEQNLKLLLLTHGDCDHTGNASYLRTKYNLKIAMHVGDLKLVETLNPKMLLDSANFKSPILKLIFNLMKKKVIKNNELIAKEFEKFTPDIFIDESTDLLTYGLNAKILHISGHTDGSIGILLNNGDFISGDIFTNMIKPAFSPNAKNFLELEKNCQRLKSLDIKTVYVGHGKPFDFRKLKI